MVKDYHTTGSYRGDAIDRFVLRSRFGYNGVVNSAAGEIRRQMRGAARVKQTRLLAGRRQAVPLDCWLAGAAAFMPFAAMQFKPLTVSRWRSQNTAWVLTLLPPLRLAW